MIEYARVRSLVEGLDTGEATVTEGVVERLAGELRDAGEHGVLRLSFGDEQDDTPRQVWAVSLDDAVARRIEDGQERGTVGLYTAPATFARMADGSYSPVRAFLDGKIRVVGDIDLGKRLLRHLAGPEGRTGCA